MNGSPDTNWALSIISPFHFQAKGARIPNIQAAQTVTATDFQDLGTFSVLQNGLFITHG